MRIVIDIIFTGLIAFVPNSSEDPSLMTAYLVEEQCHVPALRLFGRFGEFSEQNPFGCQSLGHIDEQELIQCDIVGTDIFLERPTAVRPRHIRRRPRREPPDSLGEKSSLEWLLQMNNIEAGTGIPVSRSKIKRHTAASFSFGWEIGQVCALDGSERGVANVLGFVSQEGDASTLRQAMAESLIFSVRVQPGPIVVRLRKRDRSAEFILHVRCSGQNCLTMDLANSFSEEEAGCSLEYEEETRYCTETDHFKHYYNLVANKGNQNYPEPSCEEEEEEEEEEEIIVDEPLLECRFRFYRPAPDLERCLREGVKDFPYITEPQFWSVLRECAPDLYPKTPPPVTLPASILAERQAKNESKIGMNEFYVQAYKRRRKVQDRIVCPPVLLSQ